MLFSGMKKLILSDSLVQPPSTEFESSEWRGLGILNKHQTTRVPTLLIPRVWVGKAHFMFRIKNLK